MSDKTDLRVRKTYRALSDTFIRMMQKMDFNELTVNELCERSLVGRGTFYKHFADKYEFLSFLIREQYGAFLSEMSDLIQNQPIEAFIVTMISSSLEFFEQSPALMSALENSLSSSVIEKTVSEVIAPDITFRLKERKVMGDDIPFDAGLAAELIVSIGNQAVFWWIRNQEKVPKEQFIAFLRRSVNRLMASEGKPALFDPDNSMM